MAYHKYVVTPSRDLTSPEFTRGCMDKIPYPSKGHAMSAVRALKRAPYYRDKPGQELHAYKCKLCRKFHAGHSRTRREEGERVL